MDSPVSQFEEDEWVDVEQSSCPKKSLIRFLEYMGAGATSKTIASCVAYPHGKFSSILEIHYTFNS